MEFVTGKRQVVMNFSEKFCKTEVEVLNSDCFKEVWTRYVEGLYKSENQAFLPVLNIFPRNSVVEYTTNLFKLLFAFDIEEIKEMDKLYSKALAKKEVLYDLVQHFYDYWRRLERYAVVLTRSVKDGVESTSFIKAQEKQTSQDKRMFVALKQDLVQRCKVNARPNYRLKRLDYKKPYTKKDCLADYTMKF